MFWRRTGFRVVFMPTPKRLLPLAVLVLAFLAAPVAHAAEDPLVPLLTGGQVTYKGTAQSHLDWDYHGTGYVKAFDGYEAGVHRAASITFSTSWLAEGRYPDVPVARPVTDMVPAHDYRADIGSGFSRTRQQVYSHGTLVESHDRTCQFDIRLDAPPITVPADEGGRALLLDPILERDEVERSGCDVDGPFDVFTHWDEEVEKEYRFTTEVPRTTSVTTPVLISGRKPTSWCGQPLTEIEQCDYAVTGEGAIELSCALCVDDLQFEHGDVPSYAWKKIGEGGTYDGNRIRITAKVRNATKQAITAPVALRDMTHKKALSVEGLPQTITVAPGETKEVRVEWDSVGFAWEDGPAKATLEHDLAFLTPYGSAQKLLRIKPKPVILVHGWRSDASTWEPYPGFLKAHSDRWLSHAVSGMNTDPEGPRSIFENAEALARETKAIRESEDADHVDIVAHSMGGLISRAYIDRTVGTSRDGKPWVSHLVMLGTPNMGSPCANAIYLLWSGRPTLELTPEYVQRTFNPAVRNRKGVPFSLLAGVALPRTCQEDTMGDGVVALPSAVWEIGDVGTRLLAHTSMTGSQDAYESFVHPRIAVGPGAGGSAPRVRAFAAKPAAKRTAAPVSAQVLGGRKLTLAPKGRATVPFTLEAGTTVTVVVGADDDVATELVAPDGKVAAAVKPGSPEALAGIRTLRAKVTRGGRWTLRLTGGAARGKVAVAATVRGSKLKLIATAKRTKRGTIVVTARFARAGAKVTAIVRPATGRAVRVTLRRRGGRFTATAKKVAADAAGVTVTARAGAVQRTVTLTAP